MSHRLILPADGRAWPEQASPDTSAASTAPNTIAPSANTSFNSQQDTAMSPYARTHPLIAPKPAAEAAAGLGDAASVVSAVSAASDDTASVSASASPNAAQGSLRSPLPAPLPAPVSRKTAKPKRRHTRNRQKPLSVSAASNSSSAASSAASSNPLSTASIVSIAAATVNPTTGIHRNAFNALSSFSPYTKVYNTTSKSRSKMSSVYSDRLSSHDTAGSPRSPASAASSSSTNTPAGAAAAAAAAAASGGFLQSLGPPKTSRFYKSLPESSSSASTHHYNPYLYLQHRTRVNPPLDFNLVDTRENIDENYQYRALDETEVLLSDEIDFSASHAHDDFRPKDLPVFYMSEDEFSDPVLFVEKIGHIGRRYGAIKVVPPSSWSSAFSLNTELFWFRSRRQLLNNFRSEMDARLEFYYDLFNYHYLVNKKKNAASILNKLPSIDKRILDLFRLRKYVKLRGGFHVVCKKKLWAQIGRELGYSGRIMTSLSSSLKSAYQRVILDFDEYQEKLEPQALDTANANGKRMLLDSSFNSNDGSSTFNGVKKQKVSNGSILNPSGPDKEYLQSDNVNDYIQTPDDLPVILGSSVEYKRPRDILRSKGFHTYFNKTTEEKKSITRKDRFTLSSYNFNDWFNQSLLNVLDTPSYDSKLAPLYNLKQFFEKNIKFEELVMKEFADLVGIDYDPTAEPETPVTAKAKTKHARPSTPTNAVSAVNSSGGGAVAPAAGTGHSRKDSSVAGLQLKWPFGTFNKPEDEKMEKLYWKVLFDRNTLHEVESGMDITSTVHESAFPTITCPQPMNDNKVKESLDPWNLNNFPINDKCLLKYLDDDDYSSIARTRLQVGMTFSTENWNLEDHFLYKASYNHLGATRVWYTIPPAYQQKYESLVKTVTRIKRENFQDDEDISREQETRKSEKAAVVFDVQNTFSIQEYFNCSFDNKVPSFYDNDRFVHSKNGTFGKYFTRSKANLTKQDRNPNKTSDKSNRTASRIKDLPTMYNQDTFFPPEYLIKHGIPVYKTYQKPGQFIIKFARAYSASVSLGFSVGESVNFAPPSWIEQAFEAEKWLTRQNIVPAFSAIKLLVNIAKSQDFAKNEKLKDRIRPLFAKFYKTEIELREKFYSLFPALEPKVLTSPAEYVDYKDTISDHNLETCFPSKVVLITKDDVRFQVSLHNFLQVYETNKKFAKLFEDSSDKKVTVELQVYFTDKELKRINSLLFENTDDTKEWVAGFTKFMAENPKPELAKLRQMLTDGTVLNAQVPQYKALKKFLTEAHSWVKNAQTVLRGQRTFSSLGSTGSLSVASNGKGNGNGNGNGIATGSDSASADSRSRALLKAEFAKLVIDAIPTLQFTCPEISELTYLADLLSEYNRHVAAFLSAPNHTIGEFSQLIQRGESFGIELKSLRVLKQIVLRMEWREKAANMLSLSHIAPDGLDVIKGLYTTGVEFVKTNNEENENKKAEKKGKEKKNIVPGSIGTVTNEYNTKASNSHTQPGDFSDSLLVQKLHEKLQQGEKLDTEIHSLLQSTFPRPEEMETLISQYGSVPVYPETLQLVNALYCEQGMMEAKLVRTTEQFKACKALIDKEIEIEKSSEFRYNAKMNKSSEQSEKGGEVDEAPQQEHEEEKDKKEKEEEEEEEEEKGEDEDIGIDDDSISDAKEGKVLKDDIIFPEEDKFLREFSLQFDGETKDVRPLRRDLDGLYKSIQGREINTPEAHTLVQEVNNCDAWVQQCLSLFAQYGSPAATAPLNKKTLKDVLLDASITNKVSFGLLSADTFEPPENDLNKSLAMRRPHCFCRKSETTGRFIQCVDCREWYHERCLKKTYNYAVLLDEAFVCTVCSPRSVARKVRRPTFKEVLRCYFDGRRLVVCPDAFYVLTEMVKDASVFLKQVAEALHFDFASGNALRSVTVAAAAAAAVGAAESAEQLPSQSQSEFQLHEQDEETFHNGQETDAMHLKYYLRKFESSSIHFKDEVALVRARLNFLQSLPEGYLAELKVRQEERERESIVPLGIVKVQPLESEEEKEREREQEQPETSQVSEQPSEQPSGAENNNSEVEPEEGEEEAKSLGFGRLSMLLN